MPPLPTISPVATQTGDVQRAGQPTELLALSDSLNELSRVTGSATQGLANRMRRKAEIKAQKDALASGGAELADAVRDGTIERTQNPFYVAAYERQSGAVRGRRELENLKIASQTWAERGDPEAFERRWSEELGRVGKQFEGVEQSAGFNSVASEITQQTFAGNTALAVKRINDERTSDAVAQMSQKLRSGYATGGGNLTAEEAHGLVAEDIDEWIATGGTLEEAEDLFLQGLIGAAFQVGDGDLVDIAKATVPGSDSAIFDRPGQAQELAFQRYRIEQAATAIGNKELKEREDAIRLRGTEAVDAAYAKFGTALNTSQVTIPEVVRALTAEGYSPQEIDFAVRDIGRSTFESTGTTKGAPTAARVERLLDIEATVRTEGWTEEVEADVIAATVRGDLTPTQARSLKAKGISVAADENTGFDLTKAGGLNRMTSGVSVLIKQQVINELGADIRYSPDTKEWERELQGIANAAMLSADGSEAERVAAAKAAMQAWSNQKVRDEIGKQVERQKRRQSRRSGGSGNSRREGNR